MVSMVLSERRRSPQEIISNILHSSRSRAEELLNKYMESKIIQLGLATSSFTHRMYIGYNNKLSTQTLSKLKVLFTRYLLKIMPYLTFSNEPFLKVVTNHFIGLEAVISSYSEARSFPEGLTSIRTNPVEQTTYLFSTKEVMVLLRYLRYLNAKFRKFKVPIMAKINPELIFDGESKSHIRTGISFVPWNHICSLEALERITTGEVPEGDFYYNLSNWSESNNIIGRGGAAAISMAKVFFYLRDGLKIFTTLSRKVYYESTAYSFRIKTEA